MIYIEMNLTKSRNKNKCKYQQNVEFSICLINQLYNYKKQLKMNHIPILLSKLIQYAEEGKKFTHIFKEASQQYNIEALHLERILPKTIIETFDKLNQNELIVNEEFKPIEKQEKTMAWSHFQFKTFSWISICLSFYLSKDLALFGEEEVSFLRRSFPLKTREFILYNLESLIKQNPKIKSKWSTEECQILTQLIRENPNQHIWSSISLELFTRSECRFFRPRDKCREQWLNHLDPTLNKGKWSTQEDILLLKSAVKYGKRWSRLSKIFNGERTEHMVKNRYNSLMQKAKKRWVKNKDIEARVLEELQIAKINESNIQENQVRNSSNFEQIQELNIEEEPVKHEVEKIEVEMNKNVENGLFECWNEGSILEEIPMGRQNTLERSFISVNDMTDVVFNQEEDLFDILI